MKNPFKKLKERMTLEDREQPFLEHLEAFRKMLVRCVITVAVCTAVCIPFVKPVIRWLQAPIIKTAAARNYDYELITTTPVEGFLQVVKVIFATGILISLPLLIFFIAQFVLPGLKPNERKLLTYGGIFGGILFAAGVAMCYSMSLPVAVGIMFYFNDYLGTVANWKIDKYLGFVLQLLIGFGLAFELPLILLLAGRMGLVTVEQLTKYRRHVIVGILVVAMVLTPPDVITQLQMAIPLYILYECCILILRLMTRRKRVNENESAEIKEKGTEE
ncbi:MAG: twin-arginine translocase subunit TatC [Kiritimatiellales bacterium]